MQPIRLLSKKSNTVEKNVQKLFSSIGFAWSQQAHKWWEWMYLERNVNSVSRSQCKHKTKSQNLRASQVLYQSDTQLLNQSNNQWTVSWSCITSLRHSATAEAISQSIHVSNCQLVQYYFSQTLSYCWGNQSINTCKSPSVSPVLLQSDTQLLLRQSVNQYM